jgi:hypothetical protein
MKGWLESMGKIMEREGRRNMDECRPGAIDI